MPKITPDPGHVDLATSSDKLVHGVSAAATADDTVVWAGQMLLGTANLAWLVVYPTHDGLSMQHKYTVVCMW